MESQPRNPEFRNNPENVHPGIVPPEKFEPETPWSIVEHFGTLMAFQRYFFKNWQMTKKTYMQRLINFTFYLSVDQTVWQSPRSVMHPKSYKSYFLTKTYVVCTLEASHWDASNVRHNKCFNAGVQKNNDFFVITFFFKKCITWCFLNVHISFFPLVT